MIASQLIEFICPFYSRRDESAGRQHSQYVPKKLTELNLHQGVESSETPLNHTGT